MSQTRILPCIIYGLGVDGFDIQGMSHQFPSEGRKAFLNFAKSISWRPAKLEAKNAIALALVPSHDGVVSCRITEGNVDIYGRNLVMQIEGVFCGDDENTWKYYMVPEVWPKDTISDPYEMKVSEEVDNKTTALPHTDWTPTSLIPHIMASRKIVNAPAQWFII